MYIIAIIIKQLYDLHFMYMYYSGESGAGKTESTKFVVKQIIELCNGNTQLEQQILQVSSPSKRW